MSLRLATWNVNSVRKRMGGLKAFAEETQPDIICLQETKVIDDLFPAIDIAAFGYPYQAIYGIKGYNGVAILSKLPLTDIEVGSWCDRQDGRHIFARTKLTENRPPLEIHSLYVPAGGDKPDPIKNPKFAHKLEFLTELTHWWAARGPVDAPNRGPSRILCGDFNVAPLPSDVWSHERLKNIITHTEIEITHLETLRRAGDWLDAIRHLLPDDEQLFTWWSYRTREWEMANKGRRLDHIWVSSDLKPALLGMSVFRQARYWDPPSDHIPLILDFDEAR